MRTHERCGRRLLVVLGSIAAAALCIGSASAKSVYLIADINNTPVPIHAYDIQPAPAYLAFQKERDVPAFGGGAVGIAIDGDAKKLLVTYESSNVIQLLDARGFTNLGTTTAPGAANLAGIVVDHSKQKVYAIERDTNLLYVYSWVAASNALTLQAPAIPLAGVARGYGLALDESRKRLYIGDIGVPQSPASGAPAQPVVRYFETDTWTLAGTVALAPDTQPPMSIAVDSSRNVLYMGNATAALGSQGQVVKYDLANQTQSSYTLAPQPDNVLGIAVDEDTGNLYVTTGDALGGGSDRLLAFDDELSLLASEPVVTRLGNHGNPTGIAVARFDVSFNPLNFDKVATPEPVRAGGNLTYRLCYDNLANDTAFAGVTITDVLPPGITFVSASQPGQEHNGTITWDIGEVTARAQQACHELVVSVSAVAAGTIINSATISGTIGSDTIPTTQTSLTTVLAPLQPLGLVVGDGLDTVESGANATYAVCYDNVANDSAVNNVAVEGALPTGTSFVSLSGPGNFDGQRIRWDIGTVPANATAVCNSFEVKVTADQGTITAAMQLSGDDVGLSSSTDTTVLAGALQPLNITLDDGVATVDTSSSLTFQVCYDNSNNEGAVSDVVVSGAVPTGSVFVSADGGGILDGDTIVWNEGTVIPSPLPICHDFIVRVTAAAGTQVSASMQVAGDSVESAQAAHSTTVVAATPPPPPPPPPPDQLRTTGGGGAFGFIELLLALGMLALASIRRRHARSPRPVLAVGLLAVFACSAQAQDDLPGWYLGAKFGQTQADASAARLEQALASLGHDVEVTMDTTDTGWAVFGGYRFANHFAVEAGYVDLGQITSTIHSDVQTQAQFQQLVADTARVQPYSFDGYTLAGIVNVALRNVSVFAKVGLIHWQSNADVLMPSPGPVADLSEDGTDALVGAGLAYNWAKHWGLRAEWERYSAERNDVDLTSLSLMYRF